MSANLTNIHPRGVATLVSIGPHMANIHPFFISEHQPFSHEDIITSTNSKLTCSKDQERCLEFPTVTPNDKFLARISINNDVKFHYYKRNQAFVSA
jgi:hypothetical protein